MGLLSPRLMGVLGLISPCHVLADIGSDHGYLPIQAVEDKHCQRAIAADINKGPVASANKNIAAAGLSSYIETRLGSGLTPILLEEIDAVAICGMGGMLIGHIILEDIEKARRAKQLILQPQHDIDALRRLLHAHGFLITQEVLVQEKARFYVILKAHYTGHVPPWTNQEYFLGKHLQETLAPQNDPVFLAYKAHQREKINRYVHLVNNPQEKKQLQQKLDWLR